LNASCNGKINIDIVEAKLHPKSNVNTAKVKKEAALKERQNGR